MVKNKPVRSIMIGILVVQSLKHENSSISDDIMGVPK